MTASTVSFILYHNLVNAKKKKKKEKKKVRCLKGCIYKVKETDQKRTSFRLGEKSWLERNEERETLLRTKQRTNKQALLATTVKSCLLKLGVSGKSNFISNNHSENSFMLHCWVSENVFGDKDETTGRQRVLIREKEKRILGDRKKKYRLLNVVHLPFWLASKQRNV